MKFWQLKKGSFYCRHDSTPGDASMFYEYKYKTWKVDFFLSFPIPRAVYEFRVYYRSLRGTTILIPLDPNDFNQLVHISEKYTALELAMLRLK